MKIPVAPAFAKRIIARIMPLPTRAAGVLAGGILTRRTTAGEDTGGTSV